MTGSALIADLEQKETPACGTRSLSGRGRPFSAAVLIWSDTCDGGETHPGGCLAPQVAFDKRGRARRSYIY